MRRKKNPVLAPLTLCRVGGKCGFPRLRGGDGGGRPHFGHGTKSVARWRCPNCATGRGEASCSLTQCPPGWLSEACRPLWGVHGSCFTARSHAALQCRAGNEGGCICGGIRGSRWQLPAPEFGQSPTPLLPELPWGRRLTAGVQVLGAVPQPWPG